MKRLFSAAVLLLIPVLSVTAQGMDQPPEVPEPATWTLALLGGGSVLVVSYLRKRRR